jgi:hypothetical protein
MQIAQASVPFGAISGSGPQVATTTVNLGGPVSQAAAVLTGFIVEFSGGDDHHLGQLDVQVAVPPGGVSGSSVTVNTTFGLRDWSGNWDDRYDGTVFFSVIGD